MTANEIRMPFAEWLFRMSEAHLAPQARELAVYAVAFKVTTNEELARLSGMDTTVEGKSLADKTYNKWKKALSDDGWVIVKAITKGRVTTIEVFPAFHETPVTFTDLKARDARKFDESKSYGSEVEVTDVEAGSPVAVTDEPRNSYAPAVEVTAVSRARIVSPSGINNTLEGLDKSPLYPPTDGERITFENGRLELKNGLRQFWLEKFGDEELLDLALIQAAGYVQPNSMKPLEAQVSAQLARKIADKRDKDARYAKAVKANKQPVEAESRTERWARKLKEIEAEGGTK